MKEKIATARITTPEELVLAGEALANSWFRGQGSFDWGLESTIERDASQFNVPRQHLMDREQVMLHLFKERAGVFNDSYNQIKTDFAWHALIRHYGGPSRLLDITSSYLVAAYFALNDSQPDRDATLWAFSGKDYTKSSDAEIDRLYERQKSSGITIHRPNQLNDRIHSQSGSFFIPHSLDDSLESQIENEFNTDLKNTEKYRTVKKVKSKIKHRIWKFKIPRECHSELFRFLSRCNVRAYSLIPGIDGLALSLREMMRVFD